MGEVGRTDSLSLIRNAAGAGTGSVQTPELDWFAGDKSQLRHPALLPFHPVPDKMFGRIILFANFPEALCAQGCMDCCRPVHNLGFGIIDSCWFGM